MRPVVATQLVERSLTKLENYGSIPVTGNFYRYRALMTKNCIDKPKVKKKKPGKAIKIILIWTNTTSIGFPTFRANCLEKHGTLCLPC